MHIIKEAKGLNIDLAAVCRQSPLSCLCEAHIIKSNLLANN